MVSLRLAPVAFRTTTEASPISASTGICASIVSGVAESNGAAAPFTSTMAFSAPRLNFLMATIDPGASGAGGGARLAPFTIPAGAITGIAENHLANTIILPVRDIEIIVEIHGEPCRAEQAAGIRRNPIRPGRRTPSPATVVMIPSAATRRTRWLPVSAI